MNIQKLATTACQWLGNLDMHMYATCDQLIPCRSTVINIFNIARSEKSSHTPTEPRSAVGNVSGNICESDCRSGVTSSIPAQSHTFVEIDYETIPTVILLPSAESFKKDKRKYVHEVPINCLFKFAQEKKCG